MKIKISILLLTVILLSACKSNDGEDCTKTITIPQIYFVNNQSYSYDITQEVPCDFPEPSEPELIQPPELENFTYDVLSYTFTPDTGNNTSRLQFEIRLNNPNSFSASGIPVLTFNTDGLVSTGGLNNASIPCFTIEANSNCILTYDQQTSLDLAIINSIQLINVQYLLRN